MSPFIGLCLHQSPLVGVRYSPYREHPSCDNDVSCAESPITLKITRFALVSAMGSIQIQTTSAHATIPCMRVLVIEDDEKMARLIKESIEISNHSVMSSPTGERGIDIAMRDTFDVIILDVTLPGIDGFETCRRLRKHGVWTPVMMLTARDAVEDRVSGLDAGSDDYLVKPFSLAELLARIRAMGRRGDVRGADAMAAADVRVDLARRQAWRAEDELLLTLREFDLLVALMRTPGRAVERHVLLDEVWEESDDPSSNVVDQYIAYLRRKIDAPYQRQSIETVRGIGYRFNPDV
jgi:two-component system OmpR family response regulator